MPLAAIDIAEKYKVVFGTIGPAEEEWGEDLLSWIGDYWTGKAIVDPDMPIRLKFETSNDGYKHFHLAMMFTERVRFGMFVKALQKYMRKFKNGRHKDYSIRLFMVPYKESHNDNVLRGPALVRHYLENPTKEKDTGGGNFVVDIEGFNTGAYVKRLRDQGDITRAANVEAYARKYMKYAKTHDMPPVSWYILDNKPNLQECEELYKYAKLRDRPSPKPIPTWPPWW